jgi:hypothetical protein
VAGEFSPVSLSRRARAEPRWPLVVIVGSLWGLVAAPVHAQTPHVENRCPRLSAAAYEELDARVLLALSSEQKRPAPAVVCSKAGAWVEWEGERFAISGKASIADEVVDIIEARLRGGPAPPADPSATSGPLSASPPAPATASARPVVGKPADRVATRPADARGGGIGLGIETEVPSASVSTAVGPAFDFAASVGPILLGGREAIRFSVAGPRVSIMDFQATVGYGAPFDPGARFGVVARFGAEWLVAYPEGNSGQAKVAPISALGLRLAHSFGTVGLWFGVDGHFRLTPLALHSRGTLAANDIGGSFTLGVAFVDWSRK